MTTVNFTTANITNWFVGMAGYDPNIVRVGFEAVIYEYGWWLLVVLGVLFVAFIYTKHLVLAIMVSMTCAVNVWWIGYASIPTVPMILARCVFILLIGFVWLFLLQARRVSYAGTDT